MQVVLLGIAPEEGAQVQGLGDADPHVGHEGAGEEDVCGDALPVERRLPLVLLGLPVRKQTISNHCMLVGSEPYAGSKAVSEQGHTSWTLTYPGRT